MKLALKMFWSFVKGIRKSFQGASGEFIHLKREASKDPE